MKKKFIIAIDGASGTGKSTISKLIAKNHDLNYIDTGAIYRSLALYVKENGINLEEIKNVDNKTKLKELCLSLPLRFEFMNGTNRVFLANKDVSEDIRTPKMSMLASKISAVPVVRASLLDIQGRLARETIKNGSVVDGRDMGTVVFPNAELKIFLIASDNVRAQRHYNELKEKGMEVKFQKILEETIQRDKQDSSRAIAPLKKANDAVEIDTEGLDIEGVVKSIEKAILALSL